jgi:hypothetical protein
VELNAQLRASERGGFYMSSEDDSFVALGPTHVGFMTHGTRIDVGADIVGTSIGILGRCEGGVAIHGVSTNWKGVVGESEESNGVEGRTSKGNGVEGQSVTGNGVVGKSDSDRGGVFQSGQVQGAPLVPQLQLVPQQMVDVPGQVRAAPQMFTPSPEGLPKLPKDGRGGDLLVTQDGERFCTLWFCVQGSAFPNSALWCQVLLGDPIPGLG